MTSLKLKQGLEVKSKLPIYGAVKNCSRCDHNFHCGGEQCWCKLAGTLLPFVRKWLSVKYGDCLCPICLDKFEHDPGLAIDEINIALLAV